MTERHYAHLSSSHIAETIRAALPRFGICPTAGETVSNLLAGEREVSTASTTPSIVEEDLIPAQRGVTMRQMRQMLRLLHAGVSAREVGRRLGLPRSTVQDNQERAKKAGIVWRCHPI